MKKYPLFFIVIISILLSSCSFFVSDLSKLTTTADYKVVTHYEAIDFEGYDNSLDEIQVYKGAVGKKTSIQPLEKPGFELQTVTQKKIQKDGSTVIDVYYKRNIIKVIFNPNGGQIGWGLLDLSNSPLEMTGKYGSEIKMVQNPKKIINDPVRIEWNFIGWALGQNPDENAEAVTLPVTFPETDMYFTAMWHLTKIPYMVVYKYQNADGTTYSEIEETRGVEPDDGNGNPTVIQLSCDSVEGYLNPVVHDGIEIIAPGNYGFPATVYVEYNRKEITLTLNAGEGKWADSRSEMQLKGLYGAAVEPVENPVRGENWGFAGWNREGDSLPAVFPIEDATYNAVWAKPYSKYIVEHWFEKVDSNDENDFENNYEKNSAIDDEQQLGSVGKPTNAQAKDITGFYPIYTEEKIIPEDDNTVVRIYYARKMVTVRAIVAGGQWADNSTESRSSIPGKYGSVIKNWDVSVEPTKELWEFLGWNEVDGVLPTIYPAQNEDYIALWNQVGAIYSVEYYFEKIDSNDNTDFENNYEKDVQYTQTFAGKIGDNPSPDRLLTVEGFETAGSIITSTIQADTIAVFKYYLKRKETIITFKADGGYFEKDGTKTPELKYTGKYERLLNEYKNYEAKKENCIQTGWYPSIPENLSFGLQNQTYTVVWEDDFANYKVQYWYEKVDSQNFTGAEKYSEDEDGADEFKGYVGKLTEVQVPGVNGFAARPVENQIIKRDNSTVVNVYYDRKTILYTFDANGGVWQNGETTKIVEGKYGTTLLSPDVDELSREDYEFVEWNPEAPDTFGYSDSGFEAIWKKVKDTYTVKYYYEEADTGNFIEKEDERVTGKGIIGQLIPVTASAKDGFNNPEYTPVKLGEEGFEVEVRYSRKEIFFTFKTGEDGKWSDNSTADIIISGKYGTAVTGVPVPVKENWSFAGWNKAGGIVPVVYPAENCVFEALWLQNPATYTVKHLFESVDGTSYNQIEGYAEQLISGIAGTDSNATAYDVSGFEAQGFAQQKIKEDNSLIIEIKYDRKEITFLFNENGGTWINSSAKTLVGKYGTDVQNVPDENDLTNSEYYEFEKWTPEVPASYGSENQEFKAVWTKVKADYTVQYYKENIDGTYSKLENEDSYKGKVNTIPEISDELKNKYKPEDGYDEVEVINQMPISANDDTVVRVNYKLKQVTYTFIATGGKWRDETSDIKTVTGKFGETVVIPDTEKAVKSGCTFAKWSKEIPQTFGEENDSFEVLWNGSLSGLGLNTTGKDVKLTYKLEGNNTITVTAATPYESNWSFKWEVDNEPITGSKNLITITLPAGVHSIMVYAYDQTNGFTSEIWVTIQ